LPDTRRPAGAAGFHRDPDRQPDDRQPSVSTAVSSPLQDTHFIIRPAPTPTLHLSPGGAGAFGLVMIYRIDPDLARDQANWFVLGLVLFALTIQFLRDYDVLERYRYTIAGVGLLLLLAPRMPGIGQQVNGAYLGVKIGPLAFQPAEFAKICIVVFLQLPERAPRCWWSGRATSPASSCRCRAPRATAAVWGAAMFMLIFIRDLGSSLMFFGAFSP
jgi:cell division protein FtsW (lipid II flippase)